MRKTNTQTGSAHVVIIAVIIVALLGALGFVFWNNFMKKDTVVTQNENKPKPESFCLDKENVAAEGGAFCSEKIGIKLAVPSIFVNKLAKADNYEVFEGSLDPKDKKSAGTSEQVYQAVLSGNDNFTLTIAQEPLRSGYVGVGHLLQNTYFDKTTGELTLVKTPTRMYDAATGTYTTTGDYSNGDAVPSFMVSGIRFFKGQIGDAGTVENTYFGVVGGKIIRISLKHVGYMGNPADDPSTIDAEPVLDALDKAVRVMKIAKS